ncbi:hypothetical protein JYT16_00280 [Gemmatimonas aurantiaca]|nr:hypothetical protein [Gemmatimonas aurantiaca]
MSETNKRQKKQKKKKTAGDSHPLMRFIEDSKAYPYALFSLMVVGILYLFSDFIFSDRMLSGSDTINAGVFFREMLVEHVKNSGSIPKWNPYIFGGMPYVDAFHGDIFYPLSVIKYFGSIFRVLGWALILHVFLAGIFMYSAARQFNIPRLPASLAALGYMFSGYFISLVAPGHDGKMFVTALFPLTMLFLDRAFQRDMLLNFSLLGLTIGVIILSPHPQMSYFALMALGFYTLYLLYQRFKSRTNDRTVVTSLAKHGFGFALAVVLGLGVSAIQFYPGVNYTQNFSPRADSKSGYQWATSWSLHEEDVVNLINPQFGGTNASIADYPDVKYWGQNYFKDNSEYAGVVVLFFGLIGVFFYRRKGIFFGSLALFALSYALADTTPLFRLYYWIIPNVKSMRAASMIMFIFSFSLSLCAGFGLQWVLEKYQNASATTRSRFQKYLLISAGSLGALALLWGIAGEAMLSGFGNMFFDNFKTQAIRGDGTTRWTIALQNLPSAQRGFWISFMLVGVSAALVWLKTRGKIRTVVLVMIPLLAMFDGAGFGRRFIGTVQPTRLQQLFSPNPITNYLQKEQRKPGAQGAFRTMQWGVFGGDFLPYFDIEMVSGYHGNQLRWYDALLGGPAQITNKFLGGAALTNIMNPRFMNLVGTRFFVLPKRSPVPLNLFGAPLKTGLDLGSVVIYENPNHFPRAFLVDTLIEMADQADVNAQIVRGSANLRTIAFSDSLPDSWRISPRDSGATDSAWIIHSGMDSIVVGYQATADRGLVVTTAWYDAWRPEIDGAEIDLLRLDGAFLGVILPAGSGNVVFRYKSPRFETGKTITYSSLALCLLLLGFGWYRKRDAATAVQR